ncbi:MAG: OmpA family protein [Henriciella sp.]|nr:OmpA family protein [Henriciella sp.]
MPAAPGPRLGNWKLAYADFLTALCAFFLVMWIVHGVPAEDKAELARQFGAETTDQQLVPIDPSASIAEAVLAELSNAPELTDYRSSIRFTSDQNLVRIDISDMASRPLFETGDGRLNPTGEALVRAVSTPLKLLPYAIRIEGHTDSTPSLTLGYSNWELSADRANSARRVLAASGIPETRIKAVAGLADTRPLLLQTPHLPANRRISIVLVIRDADV